MENRHDLRGLSNEAGRRRPQSCVLWPTGLCIFGFPPRRRESARSPLQVRRCVAESPHLAAMARDLFFRVATDPSGISDLGREGELLTCVEGGFEPKARLVL